MASDETLVLKGEGNVDVQIGGPGNAWKYLSTCASMDGPSIPRGGTELRWSQDPDRSGKFKISRKIRTAPDMISFSLMTKLGKIEYLENLECPFGLRARYADCDSREDPSNYNPLMLGFSDVDIDDESFDDLVIADPSNEDEIMNTAACSALYRYRIKKVYPGRLGSVTGLGDQALNDVEFCDDAKCVSSCGAQTDGKSVIFAVSDIDVTPYASPNLVKGVKDIIAKTWTWTLLPILGFNSNVEGIECAGSRLVVSSNGDSMIAYNDDPNYDQDEWVLVSIANAPAAKHTALWARTARELWLACASGYIYKSTDAGASWTAVHEGSLTSENLWAVHGQGETIYAVGDNGVILKSTDAGGSWSDITETSTTGASLRVVKVPPGREGREVYIGNNSGQMFRSKDVGATFTEVTFSGSGAGTIDDLDFGGPGDGEVLIILQNDAGPRGRLLRDLSGGNGGDDVEEILSYTELIAAGIQLNAAAVGDVNFVMAAGELQGGYPVLALVS